MAATLGALCYSNVIKLFSRLAIYYSGLLLTAISIILCSAVETKYTLMLSVVLGGLLLGAGNPLEQTILQEVTPRKIVGQVFTSYGAMHFAAGVLGLILAGVVTELTNVNLVLTISGGFLAISAVIGWCLLPLSDKSVGLKR
jgi:MFS family permease